MELTNYLYTILLAMFFTAGIYVFMGGMVSQYPTSLQNASVVNVTAFNESYNKLTNMSSTMQGQMQDPAKQNENALAAAFGYIWGAFAAVLTLLAETPDMMNTTVSIIVNSFGGAFFYPLLPIVYLAISLGVIYGILYYLMKVK